MSMKIAIASLMQETNSFSPLPTTVATFESYYMLRGDELLTGYGEARVEVPGFSPCSAKPGRRRCRCWPPMPRRAAR